MEYTAIDLHIVLLLPNKTSYRKISWNLEARRSVFELSNRTEIWHASEL